MKNKLYSIKDKLGVFRLPFVGLNDDLVLREFSALILDDGKQTIISQFPSDFELYFVGTFDDESCEMDIIQPLHLIAKGDSIVRKEQMNEISEQVAEPGL